MRRIGTEYQELRLVDYRSRIAPSDGYIGMISGMKEEIFNK